MIAKSRQGSGLYLIFAVSGLSSLVYESLWVRLLSLGVGSTSTALSFVLAIFFAGLAGGSLWGGRRALKDPNPLLTYALLEGGIGLCALLLYYPLAHFQGILALFPEAIASGKTLSFLKFSLVLVLLIVPTLAMGATFPLLTRVQQQIFARNSSNGIEKLYAVNTFGAAFGAFATSFLLIPFLGVFLSNTLAFALNAALCAATLLWSRSYRTQAALFENSSNESCDEVSQPLSRWQVVVLFSTAAVGFTSISTQVVWNKYLGIFFGTNIYGLGIILSLFLAGIAIGSLALNVVLRHLKADPKKLLVALLGASLVVMLVISRLLNLAPVAANYLAHASHGYPTMLQIKSILAALLFIGPTAIFGALFPLSILVAAQGRPERELSKIAGAAYAFNTVGAVIASTLAGAYLIPYWGSAHTLRLGFFVLGLSAFALIVLDPARSRRKSWIPATGLVLGTLIALVAGNLDFRNIIKAAYFQNLSGKEDLKDVMKVFKPDYEEFKLIIEGESAVISLSHDPSDGPEYKNYLRLKSNGLNESIYRTDHLEALPKYEALLGFLPYLFVRDPKTAFVVGYGGGCTADYFTRTHLKRVDVVELERGVLKAADVIYNGSNPILRRPNLNLRIEDARFVLSASRDRYDIIVSQPSHSWLSGVANLFTEDFFQIVRAHLSEKGVFSQWLNLYNIDQDTLKSILRTFYTVFPHGAVFTDKGDMQMIMVGSMNPLLLNLQKLELLTQNEVLRSQLEYVPFSTPYDVLSNFSIGRTQIMELAGQAPLNTDDNAFAEVRQSSFFYRAEQESSDAQEFLSRSFRADFSDLIKVDEKRAPDFRSGLLQAYENNAKMDKLQFLRAQNGNASR
ncbi:MAG: fused MFS/spermidine synthase [Bdellovibrionota bacterium]